MATLSALRGLVAIAFVRVLAFWQDYRYFILGVLGWAFIVTNYPFGWQLPKYAEF